MDRQQCNNTFNTIKSNMASAEPGGSTTARLEHTNTDEAEKTTVK